MSTIPKGTKYEWLVPAGGGSIQARPNIGDLRPDGKPCHGGVYVNGTVYVHNAAWSRNLK